mmetsp:Transcript_99747/g.197853  ORF Transcript_99747/g.197853 Transcript_99747/m.197853 type:complete len:237 (-) Transcript_99747:27-737(-)
MRFCGDHHALRAADGSLSYRSHDRSPHADPFDTARVVYLDGAVQDEDPKIMETMRSPKKGAAQRDGDPSSRIGYATAITREGRCAPNPISGFCARWPGNGQQLRASSLDWDRIAPRFPERAPGAVTVADMNVFQTTPAFEEARASSLRKERRARRECKDMVGNSILAVDAGEHVKRHRVPGSLVNIAVSAHYDGLDAHARDHNGTVCSRLSAGRSARMGMDHAARSVLASTKFRLA